MLPASVVGIASVARTDRPEVPSSSLQTKVPYTEVNLVELSQSNGGEQQGQTVNLPFPGIAHHIDYFKVYL